MIELVSEKLRVRAHKVKQHAKKTKSYKKNQKKFLQKRIYNNETKYFARSNKMTPFICMLILFLMLDAALNTYNDLLF